MVKHGNAAAEYLQSAPIRRLRHPLDESPFWAIFCSTLGDTLAFVASLPIIALLVIILPVFSLTRWILLLAYWNTRRRCFRVSGGVESMRGQDAKWLGSAWQRSVLHAVLVFDSRLDLMRLKQALLQRVIPFCPRLISKPFALPLTAGAGHCWLPDSSFDIHRHVFHAPELSQDHGATKLQDYVGKLLSKSLSADKPPWELHVMPRSVETTVSSPCEAPDTIVILRIHQSLADGTSLVKLLCQNLSDTKVNWTTPKKFGRIQFCYLYIRACLICPLALCCWLLTSRKDRNLINGPQKWTNHNVVSMSSMLSMSKATRIKQVTRSSMNCVVLSAFAGALRLFLQSCGIRHPPDMKIVIPVNMNQGGMSVQPNINGKVSPVVMTLPVSIEGALPRLWYTRSRLKTLRSSIDPFVLYVATSALMSIAPGSCVRSLISAVTEKTASVQFSWLSGPTSPVAISGSELKAIYSLVPAQSGIGIAVSVITYSEQIYLTVATDAALGQTGEILLHHINLQINKLYELLHNRRIPGEGHRSDAVSLSTFPNIRTAPVDSIVERMYKVQQEIQRICENKRPPLIERERCQCLKAEFTVLLKELRRRKSQNNQQKHKKTQLPQDLDSDDYAQGLRHRRSMSCPFMVRPNLSTLNILANAHGLHHSENSPNSSPLKNLSPASPLKNPCASSPVPRGSITSPLKNIPVNAPRANHFPSQVSSPVDHPHNRTLTSVKSTIFSSTRVYDVDESQNHARNVPSFSCSCAEEHRTSFTNSHDNFLYSPQDLEPVKSSQLSSSYGRPLCRNNQTIIKMPEYVMPELSTIIAYDNALPINSTSVDI
nr:PREDICTED: uncharacterized protein LOC109032270 [Bemisia tabaci]XP_018899858.1 PREDICTED: uncharacterized protein LOC109032270 [Bemisia tabaci]XP_018899859.1 PREDICTED: uncharacterized protein LOC109032270 [Bemisia tabaci]XP_018899860.1 PREDICTED: uncharacterized protein LOC109032270 [Bemisia tabaci]XP_018899861.1 PREDICTED: uncharacterized protein LOC109032270 [Bemisia tabaci]